MIELRKEMPNSATKPTIDPMVNMAPVEIDCDHAADERGRNIDEDQNEIAPVLGDDRQQKKDAGEGHQRVHDEVAARVRLRFRGARELDIDARRQPDLRRHRFLRVRHIGDDVATGDVGRHGLKAVRAEMIHLIPARGLAHVRDLP